MRRLARLACLSLLIACDAPSSEDPVAVAAAPEEGPEAQPEPEGAEEAEEVEQAEEPASPGEATWGRCEDGEPDLVRDFPVLVDGEVVTLGARLDGGALAEAYDFIAPDQAFPGRWMCKPAGGGAVDVQFRAGVGGLTIGPAWSFATTEAGADGRPPTPEPANLAARALAGQWTSPPGATAEVLVTLSRCAAPNGVWLTSGAFAVLESLGDALQVDSVRWYVVPRTRVRGTDRFEAALTWSAGGESGIASWFVVPGDEGCLAASGEASRIEEFAGGVPTGGNVRLTPPNMRATDEPFAEMDPGRRALLYVAAERRELRTVEDWIRFNERQAPYDAGDWRSGRAPAAGVFTVEYAFGIDDERRDLAWTVDTQSGEVTPTTRLGELARAVQPRRLPGVDAPERRPTRLTDQQLDAPVRRGANDLAECLRAAGVREATATWTVQWDGHAYGVAVEGFGADSPLVGCVAEEIGSWRFGTFAGPPIEASSTLSL